MKALGRTTVSITQVIINERTGTSLLNYGLTVLSSDLASVTSFTSRSAAAQKSSPLEAEHS